MRIGYFIGHFPYINLLHQSDYIQKYAHGGVENAAYYLASRMAGIDHHVDVFTTSMFDEDSDEKENNLYVHRYGTSFKVASANVSFKLLTEPLKYDLDLVHAHSPIPYSDISAYRHAQKNKLPLVVTYHFDGQETGGNFIRNSGVFIYNRFLLNKFLSRADKIIVGTKAYSEKSKFLSQFHDKINIIPYGIDLEEFEIGFSHEDARNSLGLPADKKIILFFGSLVPYKGPDVLLHAFKIVKGKFPNCMLIFVGRGPMSDFLRDSSHKMGLDEDVRFEGFVSEELKPLYYYATDILCLPSINLAESFGIVNLEAMACGIPIVSSKLGGIPEIVINGVNGLLAEPGDYKAFADSLLYLLENEDVRKNMGIAGKRKAKDYSWDKIVIKTQKVYKSLLE